jgi:tripartite-type tricarboxylate transporter receptor subunit TctC
MADSGHPDIAADIWQAVLVPAGTPREIVGQLHRGVVAAMAQTQVKDRMAALGYQPIGTPPDESETEMRRELAKWAKVVREAGIKPG